MREEIDLALTLPPAERSHNCIALVNGTGVFVFDRVGHDGLVLTSVGGGVRFCR